MTSVDGEGLPSLLVVGSGSEQRNSTMLAGLGRAASITLLQPGSATWQRPLVDRVVEYPPGDSNALDAARAIASDTVLDGVVSYDETTLMTAAQIGEHLGVGAIPVRAAATVRDKHAQRRALRETALMPVRSLRVTDLDEARAAALKIGYPVVLKPRSFSGSLGVTIASDPVELGDRFATTAETDGRGLAPLPGFLVEEFLDGIEFSVDCWALDGHAEPLFTARIEKGHFPRAVNIGCIVGPGIAPADVLDAVEEAACIAALACGLDRTIVNVDLRWSKGGPHVLEVNGRPAGEYLPDLASLASGIDVPATLAMVAAGQKPGPRPPVTRAAGVAFLTSRSSMVFGELQVPSNLVGLAREVRVDAVPGQEVHPPLVDPWSRVGLAMVTGVEADDVAATLAAFRSQVDVVPQVP